MWGWWILLVILVFLILTRFQTTIVIKKKEGMRLTDDKDIVYWYPMETPLQIGHTYHIQGYGKGLIPIIAHLEQKDEFVNVFESFSDTFRELQFHNQGK